MTKGTRLTDEQKAEIRKEFKGGQKEAERLGQQYGVHYTTIYGIVKPSKNGKVKTSPRRKTARKPVDKMKVLRDEYNKNIARNVEIKREMTELFFERMLEQE